MPTMLSRLFILLLALLAAGCATRTPQPAPQATYALSRGADLSHAVDLTRQPDDIWDRMRRGFAIPDLQSDLTDKWTQYYATRPQSILRMSERASRYLYHIVTELERRNLPTELALLPFVESAYDPTAYSRAKASGLWQFVPATGRHYNLAQDWWRDERRDPIASTRAALDYLTYLYEFQGDWHLSLASYNWGEGAVRRAMDRNAANGLPTEYRSLRMPEETRNYVPKLQAIKNIIAQPWRYGIELPHVANEPYFATIEKDRDIDVEVAALLAEMPLEEFRLLNPSYNRPVIRAEHKPVLLLPTQKVDIFRANLAAYQGRLSQWQVYRSKRGESYAAIAKRHGITLGQLRDANGLGQRQTRATAQALLVPAPGARRTPAATDRPQQGGIRLASLERPAAQPAATPRRSPPAARNQPAARAQRDVVVLNRPANVRTHTVRKGDTLYMLARRYQTSVDALRRLNNLSSDRLALGKRLRVPGTAIRG